MLKILITTHFGGIAGSTYSILNLAIGLKEKGNTITLACPGDSLLYQQAKNNDIQVLNIPFFSKLDFKSIFRITRYLKNERPDIISVQGSIDRYVCIIAKSIAHHKPKLTISRRQRVKHNNFFKRWIQTKFSDRIIANSKGLKELLVRKGFNGDHISIVDNGLPEGHYTIKTHQLTKLREKYGLSPEDIVVGCVARLKRQDLLLRCIKDLPQNWKFLFVGITEQEVTRKWKDLDIPSSRTTFTGLIEDREMVLQHYPLMTVNILPSEMDGFGLSLIEAMSFDIPVMGSNYGGIPSVIQDGQNGYIFDNEDLGEMIRKLIRIIGDDGVRRDFISKGKATVEHFSLDRTIAGYEKVFHSLLAQ